MANASVFLGYFVTHFDLKMRQDQSLLLIEKLIPFKAYTLLQMYLCRSNGICWFFVKINDINLRVTMIFRSGVFILLAVMSGTTVAQNQTHQQSQVAVDDSSSNWSVFFELRHHGYDLLRYGNNDNSDSYEFYLADGLTDNDVFNGTLGMSYRVMPKLEIQLTQTEGVDN